VTAAVQANGPQGAAIAETIAIVGGTVAIGDGSEPIANGAVVFRDGRIVAAGSNEKIPEDATVVDARGKWVAAGMISAFTQLGIGSRSTLPQLNDASAARSPLSAALDVTTAINPLDAPIQVARAVGITRAFVSPSAAKSIFGGQGAVISLSATADPITKPRAFQFVSLGERGAHIAGGSRAAAYAFFHAALTEARDVACGPSVERDREFTAVLTRADAVALIAVMEGKQPLVVHVERASDILQVLSLRRGYPKLRLILAGAVEGWRVASQIAAAGVPVISSTKSNPFSFEALAATESNVGRLVRAGVTVALSTIDMLPLDVYLRQFAATLVALTRIPCATGLDWGQAFATLASRPAEAMGLEGEIGSLRPGRRADVVIWDGDPLESRSAPETVYIDGTVQPLHNHLTRLRDRYRDPGEGRLPKAYIR
jgi:imidazolonepropionase-like amidohydrolase